MTEIQIIDHAIRASILAGIEIMKVYALGDLNVQTKDDNTPVTLADFSAQEAIFKVLESTRLPVISEESDLPDFSERKNWNMFWLVDPLDGTKEFIKRNDEFTVNIALIQKNEPIAGVIYAPVTGELYAGIPGIGAWKISNPPENCSFQLMQQLGEKLPKNNKTSEFTVAISRSHMNAETEAFIEEIRKTNQNVRLIRKGSSLKTCMVAEGTADVYPRFGRTMEWDTAAGHAIAKASGKNIICPETNAELTYNKEDLCNPNFIVWELL
jgi:3'(2'), 5'-bisphosphate nucleotidase